MSSRSKDHSVGSRYIGTERSKKCSINVTCVKIQMFHNCRIITVRNSSCGKVIFSQASVILSTGERAWQGSCMAGGYVARGCAWQGACVAGGMCGRGMHDRGHLWQRGLHGRGALQVSRRGGLVSQQALQVSRPIPRGSLEGSGLGCLHGHTRRGEVDGVWPGGGLQAHTWGVSRPTPRRVSRPTTWGGCILACAEAELPSPRRLLLRSGTHPTGMHSCVKMFKKERKCIFH